MIAFDLTRHDARPGVMKVDVLRDGERVATIYPTPTGDLHIVSHLEIEIAEAPRTPVHEALTEDEPLNDILLKLREADYA